MEVGQGLRLLDHEVEGLDPDPPQAPGVVEVLEDVSGELPVRSGQERQGPTGKEHRQDR